MHYAEQVWAKRAKQSGMAEERQKSIGITIDICRRLGEYLQKSQQKNGGGQLKDCRSFPVILRKGCFRLGKMYEKISHEGRLSFRI